MKKWNYFRIVGLMGAVVLILFGSANNIWRTVKFGLEKISQRN